MFQSTSINIDSSFEYPVFLGKDDLEEIRDKILNVYGKERIALVVDENVNHLHSDRLNNRLVDSFDKINRYIVPAGEQSKSVDQWRKICDTLLNEKIRRSTPLLAIGGGVTGDLAGFAAATILRGIPLIHIPTTLLAMVDSSIGGKTGINHDTGKNLIGSFYQPAAVYQDLTFLETLEYHEWVNGLSEILKYGAISDQQILDDCKELLRENPFQNPSDWMDIIKKSVQIKADIVEQDTREAGIRAYLNFGHTFAHALESLTDYGRFSHGEAVFLGMHAALFVSERQGFDVNSKELIPFNSLYDIDVSGLKSEIDELIERMYYDKKVQNEVIRLVLLQEWERPYVTDCEDHKLLRAAWEFAFDQFD